MKKVLFILMAVLLMFTVLAVTSSAAVDRTLSKVIVSQGKTYTAFGAYINDTLPGYADNGMELTDGVVGTEAGNQDLWYAFHIDNAQKDSEDKAYYEVVIDLGAVTSELSDFIFYTENVVDWGITLPSKVEFFVSDNNTDYTSAGVGTVTGTVEDATHSLNTFELQLNEAVSGRYVKTVIYNGSANFVFGSEIQVIKYSAEAVESQAPVESDTETNPGTSDDIASVLVIISVSAAGIVVVSRKKHN